MPKQKKNKVAENTNEINGIPSIRTKKKKKTWLWIVLFLIILGAIFFVFKSPIFKVLDKATKNIPSVNKIFKVSADPYGALNKADTVKLLDESKKAKEALETKVKSQETEITMLNSKIDSLKQYEEKYAAFEKQKLEWDQKIASTNPQLFLDQYAKMNPATAEKLYTELSQKKVLTARQKELATTVGQMDEIQAASALEQILKTDPQLIKTLFEGMEIERRSLILSAMTPQVAADVIKILSPDIQVN